MKSILHLTDFSETAREAYRYALAIAKAHQAALHVVHVYDRPYASIAYQGGLSAVVDVEMDKRIRHELAQHLAAYAKSEDTQGIEVHAHLLADYTVWRVGDYLDKFPGTGLVVMGTRGATSLWHGGLFGTNTARLIRHSPIPVLAIHPKNTYKPYTKVLLAVEVFEEKSLPVIQKALDFLKPWTDVRIILAVINTPYVFYDTPTIQGFVERLRSQISYPAWELKVYNDISVEEGLRQAMETEKADLIIMGTHARKGLAQFLFGSITENIAQHLAYPLLAIPMES
jgi:nucleotide-binding universal stress UspA family protein